MKSRFICILFILLFQYYFYAISQEYNYYFGDLHSHTGYSDGQKTPADAFEQVKNSGLMHFYATTDHDYFNAAEWTDIKEQALAFTDDNFIAIGAFEASRAGGHINSFNIEDMPAGYSGTLAYYNWIISYPNSISQWNHPAHLSNDFNDFAYYTSELDSIIHLLETINDIYPAEPSYIKALDAGWHVSPSSNSDTHQDDWGIHENRTVILADTLTLNSLYEAIRNHRTYAIVDKNLMIDFKINDKVIGSILNKSSNLIVSVFVEDPDTLDTQDMIEELMIKTDGGNIVASIQPNSHKFSWDTTLSPVANNSYYYLYLKNAEGKEAFTAPFWLDENASIKKNIQLEYNDINPNDIEIKLYDVRGILIRKYKGAVERNTIEAFKEKLHPLELKGLYFMRVNSGTFRLFQRLVLM